MDFLQLAAARYSERKFDSNRPVEEEKVEKLLQAASLAPSAHNNQPWQLYVLESPQALEWAARCTPCTFGAPLIFLVCYDMERMRVVDTNQVNMGLVDASIMATHLMLAATDLGLTSCWVGRFDGHLTCDLFDLPDNIEPACFLPVGYPLAGPADMHTQRLPLDQLVLRV